MKREKPVSEVIKPSQKKTVVLCESDAKVGKVIAGIFHALNIKLEVYKDAIALLDATVTKKASLYLLDEHMPGMNAFEFVEKLGNRRLDIILLSAQPTKALVMRAVQYKMIDVVAKHTFDIPRFAKRVVRRLGMDETVVVDNAYLNLEDDNANVAHKKIFDLADKKISLEALPNFANRLLELTLRQDVTIEELEEAVTLDSAITTKCLVIANSPIYRGHTHYNKVSDAIKRLGIDKLREIVISMKMLSELSMQNEYINGIELFKLNILVAIIARGLYKRIGQQPNDDVAFTSGLIHNIGMLILDKAVGEDYFKVVGHAIEKNRNQATIERKYFDKDYVDASQEILENWKIPTLTLQAVLNHRKSYDDILRGQYLDQQLVMSVNMAFMLANASNYTCSGLENSHYVDEHFYHVFDIKNINQLLKFMAEVKKEFVSYTEIFCPNEPMKQHQVTLPPKTQCIAMHADLFSLRLLFPFDLPIYELLDPSDADNDCIFIVHDKKSLMTALEYIELVDRDARCVVICTDKYYKVCKTQVSHNHLVLATHWYLKNISPAH